MRTHNSYWLGNILFARYVEQYHYAQGEVLIIICDSQGRDGLSLIGREEHLQHTREMTDYLYCNINQKRNLIHRLHDCSSYLQL
jgi:hypothetical protein